MAVKDENIRWLEVKVEALEGYQFDPELAWAVMRDISSMFGCHIKTKTIIKTMKPDETMAKNNANNGEVFRVHFDKVLNRPAISKYGIWRLRDQRDKK